MPVIPLQSLNSVAEKSFQLSSLPSVSTVPGAVPSANLKTFKQDLNSIFKTMLKNQAQLSKLGEQVKRGKNFSPQELLSLQMRVGEMQVQVELFSKISDSVSGLVRRLHQGC